MKTVSSVLTLILGMVGLVSLLFASYLAYFELHILTVMAVVIHILCIVVALPLLVKSTLLLDPPDFGFKVELTLIALLNGHLFSQVGRLLEIGDWFLVMGIIELFPLVLLLASLYLEMWRDENFVINFPVPYY